MADRLNFEIDVELEAGLITGHAGVPGLIEAFRQTGTAEPLRDGNRGRHFCIVTNRSDPEGGSGLDLIRWHRQKAGTIEHAHDVLVNKLAGAALPGQKFAANATWLRLNVILYNLLSAYKRVGLLEELHTARPKRRRFLLLNTVGKVIRHARETLLRCAKQIAQALAGPPRTRFALKRLALSRGLKSRVRDPHSSGIYRAVTLNHALRRLLVVFEGLDPRPSP